MCFLTSAPYIPSDQHKFPSSSSKNLTQRRKLNLEVQGNTSCFKLASSLRENEERETPSLSLPLIPPPLSLSPSSLPSSHFLSLSCRKKTFFLPQETQSTTFIANAKNKEIILNQISLRGSPTGCIGTKKPSPFYLDRFPASLEKQQVGW